MTLPQLRLNIDAHFAGGEAPLYVLVLDTVSVVAVLWELAQQFAVVLNETFLDESEMAIELPGIVSLLGDKSRLVAPGTPRSSHATVRLHTEERPVEGSDELESVLMVKFTVHDELQQEQLLNSCSLNRSKIFATAFDEEVNIIRSLDGFAGDVAALLRTLNLHLEGSAVLARTHRSFMTADRAQNWLHAIYTEDPTVQTWIDQSAAWLARQQPNPDLVEDFLTLPLARVPSLGRRH